MPVTRQAILQVAIALGCAGCTVGPAYHEPQPDAAAKFGEAAHDAGLHAAGGSLPDTEADPDLLRRWWTAFHDPTLDSLIDRALRNNRDLKVAVSRVREARAEREIAAGALLPEIDATAGYNRSRGSKNVVIPFSALTGASGAPSSAAGTGQPKGAAAGRTLHAEDTGTAGTGSPAGVSSTPSPSAPPGGPNSPFGEGGLPGVTTNLFQAGFDAVWEIDVFGGTRRTLEAADAQASAAKEGERGVRVTLLAEVASTYLQLRADQAREAIARRNLESERQTWKIADDKFKEGLGDEVQVEQQAAQLLLTEATLPPLMAAERLAQHALAFLLGEDPTALAGELSTPQSPPELPPEVPVGVPSDLLRRRPDIRQAERNLATATADVGVATAQLFPQFSLTGSLGLDSSDLKHLPEWGSRYYSIAPGIRWPLLDWARLHAAIRAANEEQNQAVLAYQTAVAQALKDVEDALVQYESERDRHAALAQAVDAARRARAVAAQIYTQGLADQLATLEAEQAQLQGEDTLAQSDAALRMDLIGLYKALGGGWEFPK
jgi:NodT family efflux transporter outer membrane factor (OMF) lipoprotein